MTPELATMAPELTIRRILTTMMSAQTLVGSRCVMIDLRVHIRHQPPLRHLLSPRHRDPAPHPLMLGLKVDHLKGGVRGRPRGYSGIPRRLFLGTLRYLPSGVALRSSGSQAHARPHGS